eukprot:TRINITY_DN2556_c0_g1_i7.p1 TRINITY_DN2556_c0_g1~~TRINITY_DN2556_c0_g1_i7.p1  ORF type:complete len:269 (+),score=79.10 TRINITY_DN2556_c0_g1_i7:110-916(+)
MLILAVNAILIQLFLPVPPTRGEGSSTDARTPAERLIGAAKGAISVTHLSSKLWALYYGMQMVYIYTMLGYLVARSYKKQKNATKLPEAEQKASMALLGFAIGKFIFSFFFNNVVIALPKFMCLCVTGAVCAITLAVHTLVCSLSPNKYTPAWFFVALFWGIQDATVAGKFEIGILNPVTEGAEECVDSGALIRIIGVLAIGFAGALTRDSKPIGVMAALMVVFVGSLALSFVGARGENNKTEDKLLLEVNNSSKEDEVVAGKETSNG